MIVKRNLGGKDNEKYASHKSLFVLCTFRNHFTFLSALRLDLCQFLHNCHLFMFNFVCTFLKVKLRPSSVKQVSHSQSTNQLSSFFFSFLKVVYNDYLTDYQRKLLSVTDCHNCS